MSENTNPKSIAKQYYEGGNSPLTDHEWDALYTGLEEIGYTPESGIKHLYQMYSLKKTFSEDLPCGTSLDTIFSPMWDIL